MHNVLQSSQLLMFHRYCLPRLRLSCWQLPRSPCAPCQAKIRSRRFIRREKLAVRFKLIKAKFWACNKVRYPLHSCTQKTVHKSSAYPINGFSLLQILLGSYCPLLQIVWFLPCLPVWVPISHVDKDMVEQSHTTLYSMCKEYLNHPLGLTLLTPSLVKYIVGERQVWNFLSEEFPRKV